MELPTGRRADLVEDRTRTVNRLRGMLTGLFPGLQRALAEGLAGIAWAAASNQRTVVAGDASLIPYGIFNASLFPG